MLLHGILCHYTIPGFVLATLSGAPYNLKSWDGHGCTSIWQFKKDEIIDAGRKLWYRNGLNSTASPVWMLEQSTEPRHHSQPNSTSQNLVGFFPLWHKTQILCCRERREQDKNKPQQNFSSSFPCRIVPLTLEPCCCSRKTAGYLLLRQSWDRQISKV